MIGFICINSDTYAKNHDNTDNTDYKLDTNLLNIRVLLTIPQTSVYKLDKQNELFLTLDNNSMFKVPGTSRYIKIYNPLKNSSIFSIRTSETYSIEEAFRIGNDILNPVLAKSDLNILLSKSLNDNYFIEIGGFQNRKDAEFVKNYINLNNRTLEIIDNGQYNSFAGFEYNDNIYLKSSLSNSSTTNLLFSISPIDKSISIKNINYNGTIEIYKDNKGNLSFVNNIDIEEYLKGVVPSEMPSSWNKEALLAQAVACRTLAISRIVSSRKNNLYYDLCDTTNSQVYLGTRHFASTDSVVEETSGLVITYNNKVIEATYHSTSGGYTENNENVWSGGPRPYLRGVVSKGEEISPNYSWYKSIDVDTFIKSINEYLIKQKINIKLQSISSIEIIDRGVSPRAKKVSIKDGNNEIILTGNELRNIFSLKSTWFDFLIQTEKINENFSPIIKYKKLIDNSTNKSLEKKIINIYGKGWGHGVGLSQYGAYALSKNGKKFNEILNYYFQETAVEKFEETENFLQDINFTNHEYFAGQCKLFFDPSKITLNIDETSKVTIKVSTTAHIYGITFDIIYDDILTQINLEDVTEGSFLNSDKKQTFFLKTNEKNKIKIALSRASKSGGVSGDGDLLYFKLKAFNKGLSDISLSNIKAQDQNLNFITVDSEILKIEIKERDASPPKTQIVSYPDKFTNKKQIYFEWSGTDDITKTTNLLFSYRMNDEPWTLFSKSNSHMFNLITDGEYNFSVRAKDEIGNIDPEPPNYTFSLDFTPPHLEVFEYPKTTYEKFTIFNGIAEPDIILLINGNRIEIDELGKFTYKADLYIGNNLFKFIAIDKASNSTFIDAEIKREEIKKIKIYLSIGSNKALVDDNVVSLDSAPFIKENRTFVPLRFITESFGAEIIWDPKLKSIDIKINHPVIKRRIRLIVGSKVALVDGKEKILDVSPFIVPPGRTVVPIRFIAESFDSTVEWEPLVQGILITFPNY